MAPDAQPDQPDLGRFRDYLHLLARLGLDNELRGKLDESDVVQETLAKAQASMGAFRGENDQPLKAWLRKILANTLADLRRKYRARVRDVGRERSLQTRIEDSSARLENWLAADEASPSKKAMNQERALQLAEALAALPPDQQRAIELHHLGGRSMAETAEALGRSVPAVAGLLRRGVLALRQALNREGFSDGSGQR